MKIVILLCSLFIASSLSISAQQFNISVEKIAGGFQFVEGPLWVDSIGLLFSDIPASKVYKWNGGSTAAVFLAQSKGSNGLSLDKSGHILLAQQGNRTISRLDNDSSLTVIAEKYNGKRLNSPNDIAVKSDGSIFFTDPPYGIDPSQSEQGYAGIYRISHSGELYLLDKTLTYPNGICFSLDEKKLYTNDSEDRILYVWDVVNDSTIANKKRFVSMQPDGNADGMKIDLNGNIFCTGPLGVWIFSPEGKTLDTIKVPGQTTNCNWGNKERTILYITSGTNVYRANVTLTGVKEGSIIPKNNLKLLK